ncbi:MAG: hypothetical protein HRT45_14110, partial [Bdellovibrionales bacterium]|nr:hypothetical protein [Bdellovibrionales bacterium]
MKYSIKVLALSAPLSFLLGLALTYYQEKVAQDPNFMKPTIHILSSKALNLSSLISQMDNNGSFALKVSECDNEETCKKAFTESDINLAILPITVIRELMQSNLILPIQKQTQGLRERLHVDFRRPKTDPEGRFAVPLFWNVMGFLCHNKHCNLLETEKLTNIEKKQQKLFVFLNQSQEILRLKEQGLWDNYQYHQDSKIKKLLEERPESLIQWPSGALSERQLYELKDHSYRLPGFGASLQLYAAVTPKTITSEDLNLGLTFLSELMHG